MCLDKKKFFFGSYLVVIELMFYRKVERFVIFLHVILVIKCKLIRKRFSWQQRFAYVIEKKKRCNQ